ncbi:MAG: T9SS type A sorting domain-containing protein [Bacteroidota bacterium]
MKKALVFLLFVAAFSRLNAQQTINGSILHDGITRTYILYVPANYDGSSDVPLLFNFHGYGSSSSQQIFYGDFRPIADTAGFLIVHPQGTVDNTSTTHFNVGWGGSGTDDVGFTEALIDSIAADYAIDQSRVYSTGMSNGGFMSFHLACNLSNRIAAIGSVTGSIVPFTMSNCDATHPTPVLQIHGTADGTVPYNGGAGWSASMSSLLTHWSNYNNCDAPTTTAISNTNTTDGSTVEKIVYSNGDNCTEVVHFKITGGAHTWAGSAFPISGTNYDINASKEVWNFVSKYNINGLIGCTELGLNENEMSEFEIYPNPNNGSFWLKGNFDSAINYEIFDLMGVEIANGSVLGSEMIDVSYLKSAIYLLKIGNSTKRFQIIN